MGLRVQGEKPVLIVDDHPIIRQLLRSAFATST
jgi:hypothetical protein